MFITIIVAIFTARSELRKVVFCHRQSVGFCVWNFSETAERIAPNSHGRRGRRVGSLARTSLKVKVTRDKNIFRPFRRPACGLFGKTSVASSFRWFSLSACIVLVFNDVVWLTDVDELPAGRISGSGISAEAAYVVDAGRPSSSAVRRSQRRRRVASSDDCARLVVGYVVTASEANRNWRHSTHSFVANMLRVRRENTTAYDFFVLQTTATLRECASSLARPSCWNSHDVKWPLMPWRKILCFAFLEDAAESQRDECRSRVNNTGQTFSV